MTEQSSMNIGRPVEELYDPEGASVRLFWADVFFNFIAMSVPRPYMNSTSLGH